MTAPDAHPAARSQFSALERTYLDTAGYGLPPDSTVAVLAEALHEWQSARADWIRDWDSAGDRCRLLAAHVLGGHADGVALLPAVSVGAAVASTLLRPGDEVLLPEQEFASVLLPVLAAASERGASVRTAPFDELADAVRSSTTIVATSQVRSQDGRVQDLARLAEAARTVNAVTLVDATHAAGVLTVDADALGLDIVLAAAYKHLLCPRGVGFMHVSDSVRDRLVPVAASWRSAGEPYDHYYGASLADLAAGAARFDVSLAWHAWVGAEKSLELLCAISETDRVAWCVGLADAAATALGVRATGSSVISVPLLDGTAARSALAERHVTVSGRGRRARVSFHLYNGRSDVATLVEALATHVDHVTAEQERG